MTLTNCYIIDNPGKALGIDAGVVRMDSCLISRCDTGGEFNHTLVLMNGCYFIDMPNGDGIEIDDDNDCLYLLNPWINGDDLSTITNSVFSTGKDDGIDHNGANVYVSNCVIEGFCNEGIATSSNNNIYFTTVQNKFQQ